ncbi:Glucans biosynthesis protein C [Serratia fonticola]|uniref:Glucans biosynthesis protein C n=1 Tax=Serratia fonticola TaxID=47917 RepID=A0A4U9VPK8_SERFO|nr:Glucans biosynthesis protein C [Serratia fonticola]
METLFYLPFFIVGAYAFKYSWLKAVFLKPSWPAVLGSLLLLVAYMLNQKLLAHSSFGFELENHDQSRARGPDGQRGVRIWPCAARFPFASHYLSGQRFAVYLSGSPSADADIRRFVTPLIDNNLLGFLLGLVFVFACAFLLYELHKRIPLCTLPVLW